jgi:hypothetical protein
MRLRIDCQYEDGEWFVWMRDRHWDIQSTIRDSNLTDAVRKAKIEIDRLHNSGSATLRTKVSKSLFPV